MTRFPSIDEQVEGSRLQLDIWHPDCWTLEVTADTPGGLLGHGVYAIDGKATGRFTAYGRSVEDLEVLVDAVEASPLIDDVWEADQHYATDVGTPDPENVTTGLVVQYELTNSINDALVSRGFIPDEPVRMTDGREYWTVVTHEDRETIADRLDEIREEKSASVRIESMRSLHSGLTNGVFRTDCLSERQREVFELARTRQYYSWPREVSAADLAAELDISEATLLEHLRKAEAKLLDPETR
ncbi:helix-turn-helix domain-containing protein [Halosolutus amylolyticus]|uniref:Helix-turn-helix domain-containing protein n=1 Tax=Halosolutus amylolyticus TaxID=2932267 RepID=A0ABD5PRU4_9EURY|nr:helix-turn-helix domain-containing protein [Halosolutus amylolyticus]